MTTFIGGIMSPTFILHRPNDYYFWWIYHLSLFVICFLGGVMVYRHCVLHIH